MPQAYIVSLLLALGALAARMAKLEWTGFAVHWRQDGQRKLPIRGRLIEVCISRKGRVLGRKKNLFRPKSRRTKFPLTARAATRLARRSKTLPPAELLSGRAAWG